MARLYDLAGRPMSWAELHELNARICAEKSARPHICPPHMLHGSRRLGLACECECHG